ncbi:MAG: (d)CMP kinase [Candidatus Hadarchaeota archaeon]
MVVVAISGLHGTGKTTAAKKLAKKFRLKYVCAGEVFRQLAQEKKMSLDEFSRYSEKRPHIDRMIDRRTADSSRLGNVLIDARLAGWMAKNADARILLTAPLEVRARRIARREKRKYRDVLKETKARERSEAWRFQKFYKIDVNDYSPFDLVLNTGRLSVREMTKILNAAVAVAVRRRS